MNNQPTRAELTNKIGSLAKQNLNLFNLLDDKTNEIEAMTRLITSLETAIQVGRDALETADALIAAQAHELDKPSPLPNTAQANADASAALATNDRDGWDGVGDTGGGVGRESNAICTRTTLGRKIKN